MKSAAVNEDRSVGLKCRSSAVPSSVVLSDDDDDDSANEFVADDGNECGLSADPETHDVF